MNPCLAGFRQFLVILAEPSAAAKCAPPPTGGAAPRSGGCPDSAAPRSTPSPRWPKPTPPAGQRRRHQPRSPVWGTGPAAWPAPTWLHPGLGYWRHEPLRQEQPGGIHYYVALAPRYLLARVVAPRPPFSVVFTDWLSMLAALGVASLPSLGPGRAAPPPPAPKCHRPAIFGNTTTPCPREAGHGAPSICCRANSLWKFTSP